MNDGLRPNDQIFVQMLRKTFSRGSKSLSSVSRQYNSRSGFHFVSNDKVIYGIVGINTAVFCGWHLAQQDRRLSQFMRNNFLLSYYGVWKNLKFHTLVTSMFSHQDFWHLAGNMVTLYFFGSGAIAVLGARQFLSLYMGAGVFSSLCTASWPDLIPKSWPAAWQRSRYTPALGASGAGQHSSSLSPLQLLSLSQFYCFFGSQLRVW